MLKIKWLLSICFAFVFLSANCWSDNITSTNSDTSTVSDESKKAIVIQVSSHKKAADADRELQRLRSHGLEPFIDHELVKDKGMWYRVYVGKFESTKAATTFAKGLIGKGIISGFWVKKKVVTTNTIESPDENQSIKQEPTIEAQESSVKTETDSKIAPPIPSPTEESKNLVPPEVPKSKETDKIASEERITEAEGDKRTTATTPAAKSDKGKNKISMGLKSSVLIASGTDDLEITRYSDDYTWLFNDIYVFVGLVANLRINDRLIIESSIEKDIVPEVDIWQFGIGSKYQFRQIGLITPFIRGGLVIGSLKWDDVPGDFDPGLGFDGGAGIYVKKSKVHIGIETSYRWIKYNYNKPSGNEVSATDDHVDMSGLIFSGTISYLF